MTKEPTEFFDKDLKCHSILRFVKKGKYIHGIVYKEKYWLKTDFDQTIEKSEKNAMEIVKDALLLELSTNDKDCLEPIILDKNLKKIN